MSRLADRFADAAAACPGLPELRGLLEGVARELGFTYFALLDHASLAGANQRFLRIDNYPDLWVRELVGGGLAVDDPVHLASRRSNAGFIWRDIEALVKLEPRHRNILARSRSFELGPGFTVPANVPGEPSASCSFAVAGGGELPIERLHCAELVGARALSAARRLRPVGKARPQLSRREIQCLRLIALGKTDWEIAAILGLSIETVHHYVKRARSAYDVVSRTQLVVHALRDAWISFDEAIPPFG